jgi:integrase
MDERAKSKPTPLATAIQGQWNSFDYVKAGGETLVLPGTDSPRAVKRFDSFVQSTIKGSHNEPIPIRRLISVALATEGVVNLEDLTNLLKHIPDRKHCLDGIAVTWTKNSTVRRRHISCFTGILANKIEVWPKDWEVELTAYFNALYLSYPSNTKIGIDEFVGSVFRDAQAWLQLHLPAPCFGYLSGTLSMTLLPQHVLDRRFDVVQSQILVTLPESDLLNHAKDVAVDRAFEGANKASLSKVIVIALKNLFGDGVDDSIRTADFLQRRETHKAIGQISDTLLRSGCPADATLLLWVIHLIEFGSVRLAQPTIGTIKRYLHAVLDLLHQHLHRVGKAPVDFTEDDWQAFFDALIALEISMVQLNALATFHRMLVVQFGINPKPQFFKGSEERSSPAANVIWDHEVDRAFALVPKVTSDIRMRKQLRAVLALADSEFVRIGDIPSLRISSIQKVVGTNLLGIAVYPRQCDHQGKSDAVRRPLNVTKSRNREWIDAWIAQRDADAASPDELLFGDPNFPEKCYKFGQCQRLLNKILKLATNDQTVSFHTFRHTHASFELMNVLLTADVASSISRVHTISVRAAHKSERTTFESYFHMPERPIRHWIDKALSKHFRSPSVVGKWLDEKPNSLTVSGRRAGDPSAHHQARLYEAAMADLEKCVLPGIEEKSIIQDEVPESGLSFDNIFQILRGIYLKRKLGVIASNSNTTDSQVAAICRLVISNAVKLGCIKESEILPAGANDLTVLNLASELLIRMHCHFSHKEEDVLLAANSFFDGLSLPIQEVIDGVQAWLSCKRGRTISCINADRVRPLISMLVAAGLPASNFILRVQVKDPNAPNLLEKIRARVEVLAALSLIEVVANTTVQLEAVGIAKGRPHLYFMLARSRLTSGQVGASAKCRMNRLHGMLLALSVWCSVNSSKEI